VPPFSAPIYSVAPIDAAGVGGLPTFSVTGKAAGAFTLNDPAGGRTVEITLSAL